MKIADYINHVINYHEDNKLEVNLNHICEIVEKEYGVKCTHEYIGGFDSPGYEIDCYAIAFIDEDGEIDIVPYTRETY